MSLHVYISQPGQPSVGIQRLPLGKVAGKSQWLITVNGETRYSVIERSFVCYALYAFEGSPEPLGTFYDLARLDAHVKTLVGEAAK